MAVLLLALVNGVLYIFIVPPWQHYDEPNHFEYAWWIANHGSIPGSNDVDTSMRRQVASSMVEHHFFDHLNFLPDLSAEGKAIWIGQYSQVDDPPLYYLLVSLPLRVFHSSDVTTQLYVGRGLSLLFFLLTIVAAYGITVELTPPGHLIRFLLPFTLAFLPGFVDLMTALNNDVGLILFSSWFLWASIRLVIRGFNLVDFAWATAAVVLAVLTKQTGLLTLPILAVAVMFSLLQGQARKYAWVVLGGIGLVGIVLIFRWDQPALWYIRPGQNAPVRSKTVQAPLGNIEFRFEASPNGNNPGRMIQILPSTVSHHLAGKIVTLGAWIWANKPVQVQGPGLFVYESQSWAAKSFTVSTEPVFYAFSTQLPRKMQRGWLMIEPSLQPAMESTSIYLDGLVLAEGDFSRSGAPSFADDRGQAGVWGGTPFNNLIRNASGEQAWVGLRDWIDRLGPVLYPDYGREGLSLAFYTVRDPAAAGWYYKSSVGQLSRTFWGKFGWGNVLLVGHKPYRLFAIITILGIIGAILAAVRRRSRLNWEIVFLLGMAIIIIWAATLFKGSVFLLDRAGFLPVARYIFPVIIPTLLVLVLGWLELMRLIWRLFASVKPWLIGAYVLLFIGIDLYALFSIQRFFQG